MSTAPIENLQMKAVEERNRLHHTADELRAKVAMAREKLDMRKNVREHLAIASIGAAAIGMLAGYGVAGLFTRH